MEQQRTKSRRRRDPGQQPLPVLFPLTDIRSVSSTQVDLEYLQDVVLRGIPAALTANGELPTAAELVAPNIVRLTFPADAESGNPVVLPLWCPEMRGYNGEYAQGGAFVIGFNAAGQVPLMRWITNAFVSGANTYGFSFNGPVPGCNLDFMKINGVQVTSSLGVTPTEIHVSVAGTAVAGATWEITAWLPGMWSTAGAWIAPGTGKTV